LAEEGPPSPGEHDADDAKVSGEVLAEAITVTAQKREQPLQDAGLTVAAFSAEGLEKRGIVDLQTLSENVTNVVLKHNSGAGVPVVIIRGIGLQDFRVNNTPTAAFYIDEIYQTSVAMTDFAMFDLERLEVLKGPQGGLYGRNTTGGAVLLISRQPSLEQKTGDVQLDYDEHAGIRLEVGANAPLSERTALRFAARADNGGSGYFHSVPGGFDYGETDRWAARALFKLQGRQSDLVFKLHAGQDRSESPLLRTIGLWEPGANLVPGLADGVLFNYADVSPGLGICPAILGGRRDPRACASVDGNTPASQGLIGIHDGLSPEKPRLDNRWSGISAVANWRRGSLTFTSVTGFQEFDHGRLVDFDAIALEHQTIDYRSDIEQWSQELRLSGPVANRGYFIAGLVVGQDELVEDTQLTATSGLVPLGFGVTRADQLYEQSTDSAAAFVHLDWPLAERWTLVGEARYSSEGKEFTGGTFLPQAGSELASTDDSKDFDNVSGKLGFEYRSPGNSLVFGSVSRGFKSGGFWGGFTTNPAQLVPYDEETVTAYEVGWKTEPRAGALLFNGALFHYDYSGFQANARERSDIGASIGRLTNIGDVTVDGLETDLAWLASRELTVRLGIGYTDGMIDDSTKTVTDAFSVAERPLEGVRLTSAPKWSGVLAVTWERTFPNELFVRVQSDYSYRSEQDLSFVTWEPEAVLFEEDAYGLLDLRFTVGSRTGRVALTAFVSNLLDAEYRTLAQVDSLGGAYELFGAPRTAGVGLRYAW
jgi:iron complex outermembrane receptor protein